jgi:hypothetical protein
VLGRWIYKPITNTAWVRPRLCKFAHGRWFSPASSTTKTGRHDIAEILLKVVSKHQKSKSCVLAVSKYSTKKAFDKSNSFIN